MQQAVALTQKYVDELHLSYSLLLSVDMLEHCRQLAGKKAFARPEPQHWTKTHTASQQA